MNREGKREQLIHHKKKVRRNHNDLELCCPNYVSISKFIHINRYNYEINRRNQLRVWYLTLIGVLGFLVTLSLDNIISFTYYQWVEYYVCENVFSLILLSTIYGLLLPSVGYLVCMMHPLYSNLYCSDGYGYLNLSGGDDNLVGQLKDISQLNQLSEVRLKKFTTAIVFFSISLGVLVVIAKLLLLMVGSP